MQDMSCLKWQADTMQAQAAMTVNSMKRYFAMTSSIGFDNLIVMIYPLQNSPGQGAWSVLAAT